MTAIDIKDTFFLNYTDKQACNDLIPMTITYTLSELKTVAQKILKHSQSNILAFYGEMGVGKTTLIKQLCKELGVKETTSSPTFSIVNQYRGINDCIIYHFDFYRIEKPEEILDIGFEEYVYDGDWIFIEWPEKVFDYLPENTIKVQLIQKDLLKRLLFLKQKC